MTAFSSCFAKDEHNDPILGTFKLDAHIYCNGTGRRINGLTCCTPQTTNEIKMKYLHWSPKTRGKVNEIRFSDRRLWKRFQSSEVVFVVHGFHESLRISPWLNGTRDGWLNRGKEVIVIEWSHGNQISYWQAAANVRTIGMALGYSIYHWKVIKLELIN